MKNALKQFRKTHNLSRAELAEKVGCSVSFVGHIENRIRSVSADTAIEWEKKLGVPRHVLRPDLWHEPA